MAGVEYVLDPELVRGQVKEAADRLTWSELVVVLDCMRLMPTLLRCSECGSPDLGHDPGLSASSAEWSLSIDRYCTRCIAELMDTAPTGAASGTH